jgi:hypothetical protein
MGWQISEKQSLPEIITDAESAEREQRMKLSFMPITSGIGPMEERIGSIICSQYAVSAIHQKIIDLEGGCMDLSH